MLTRARMTTPPNATMSRSLRESRLALSRKYMPSVARAWGARLACTWLAEASWLVREACRFAITFPRRVPSFSPIPRVLATTQELGVYRTPAPGLAQTHRALAGATTGRPGRQWL